MHNPHFLPRRQIPCNTDYTPPDNCLQYFTGITGSIQSFNYVTGASTHLADQDQRVCIRPERGYCTIEYSNAAIDPGFGISGIAMATAIAGAWMGAAEIRTSFSVLGRLNNIGRLFAFLQCPRFLSLLMTVMRIVVGLSRGILSLHCTL